MKNIPEFMITMTMNILEELTSSHKPNYVGRPAIYTTKEYIRAIFKRLRTGVQWCELDSEPHFSCVYKKQKLWTYLGVFNLLWKRTLKFYSKVLGIQWNSLIIDASYVKNVRGYDKIGRNPTDRGRNASKISTLTDKRGVPLSIILDAGNIHDSKLFKRTLNNIAIRKRKDKRRKKYMYVDKGYSGENCAILVKEFGYNIVIPKKKQKGKPRPKYTIESRKNNSIRSRVEAFFGWLDQYKLLYVRMEKYSDMYVGMTHFACACITMTKCLQFL